MRTIAEHVLDIGQNSIDSKAQKIKVEFIEDDWKIFFSIEDNGCGIGSEALLRIFDPFFTTKKKKFGLGLPLLKEYAELTGGNVSIHSVKDAGTKVEAMFMKTIDCQPVGKLADTFAMLITYTSNICWEIHRCLNEKCYDFSSEDIEGLDLTSPEVIKAIFEHFKVLEDEMRKDFGGARDASDN